MTTQLSERRAELVKITKTDGGATVRHRAHVLLVLVDAASLEAAAQQCGVSRSSVYRWQRRFLAEGRSGLIDRPKSGRPSKLDRAARQFIADALERSPRDYGYPVTVWTMTDLRDLLGRWGWSVGHNTVVRAVHALGYVYRRPRHDLRHRQDAEAVASATDVLRVLQKRGLISAAECDFFISTSAASTPIPTWGRSGNDGDGQRASGRRGAITRSASLGRSSIDPGS